MKEIVKFPINAPVEVTLQFETGKRVEGRYGNRVMYSLLDDRVMYVPPYVEQRFQELAIGAGEPLLLCKKVSERWQTGTGPSGASRRAPQQALASANGASAADSVVPDPTLNLQPVGQTSDDEIVGRDGEETPDKHHAAALAQEESNRTSEEEQPSANSTAPMAQELALQTNSQHQRQDSAEGPDTGIALASARPVEPSTKESVFLPAMSMEVALARRAAIVDFTRRIMVKDQDFGEIPGTNKPTLLKPGAEKLCNFFGLEPEFTPIVEDLDWTGVQHGGEIFCYARYRCRLLREGRVVGVGEGSCNSWEAKYRYRWVAEEQVPDHSDRTCLPKRGVRRTLCEFDFAIERAETTGTYGKPAEHWQRFRDAIRTGAARQVEKFTRRGKSVAWEIDVDTALYRIPNPDVADAVNTVQKMAQKRALVAATLIATSASEFFTQDMEDADPSGRNVETGSHPPASREGQAHVCDRKLEELNPKPAVPVEPDAAAKPWKNFGEMRRAFEQIRGQVGETRYLEELQLAGVQNPGQFQSASKALACYWRLGAHRRATGGGVMAALAVVPSPAVTAAPLYLIEDQLAALIETAELVSPEQEQEFRAEFQTALTAAVEKRDHVGQFLAHLEQQIDFAQVRDRPAEATQGDLRASPGTAGELRDRDPREPRAPMAKAGTVSWRGSPPPSACGRVRHRWRLPTSQPSLRNTRRSR